MKKRSIKNLSLGKSTISTLENNLVGGAPTTDQSQYCPNDPLPAPEPHSLDPRICITRSCNSICITVCQ